MGETEMMRFIMLLALSFVALGAQEFLPLPELLDSRWFTFQGLQEKLKMERAGAVIAIAPNKAEAHRALGIMTDERIMPYGLYSIAQANDAKGDNDIGKAISEKQGWTSNAARWAFLDSNGEVAASGTGYPTPEAILKALESTFIRQRTEILKQVVRRSPELMVAQKELLAELKNLGDARTASALKMKLLEPTKTSGSNFYMGVFAIIIKESIPDLEPLESDPPLLSDSDDEAIWHEYERIFNDVMPKMLSVQTSLSFDLSSLLPNALRHSPKLKRMANRFAAKVEEALQGEPSNGGLWELWIALRPDRSIMDLLDSLEPLPFKGGSPWPPMSIGTALISHLRSIGGWEKLIGYAEPLWDKVIAPVLLKDESAPTRNTSSFSATVWAEFVGPLLESYLATNRVADAEQIVNTWAQDSKWDPAFARAAKIAKAHGFDALSEKWEKLGADK
jgi:hypothetical protein